MNTKVNQDTLENITNELNEDTDILKNILKFFSKDNNVQINEIINKLGKSWELPMLHCAIESNNTDLIHKLIENKDPGFIDKKLDDNRDHNRFILLQGFFKKNKKIII